MSIQTDINDTIITVGKLKFDLMPDGEVRIRIGAHYDTLSYEHLDWVFNQMRLLLRTRETATKAKP